MSEIIGYSLTLKHREDFDKVAAYVKQQVREKSLELLGEDLSVDGDYAGLRIDKEKNEVYWHNYGHHGLNFFVIAESVVKEFPDVDMNLESWWDGRDGYSYMTVDGHWKEYTPWIIVAYTENESDYQRLSAIAKQNEVTPENLDMKLCERGHQVCWTYKKLKEDDAKDKEKLNNLTKGLAEKLSRNLGDVELLAYYYDYNHYGYEISEIFKAKDGQVKMESVDEGISVALIEEIDSLKWIDGKEPLLLHPMEYVAEMIRRAREGDHNSQSCVKWYILEYGDKSLYENLLTEEDKKWLDF